MTTEPMDEERGLIPRPVIALATAHAEMLAFVEFVRGELVKNEDYGTIPGMAKPTLLKPGAEKICNYFGLAIDNPQIERLERWDPDAPLFHYEVRQPLRNKRTGLIEAVGVGSCNSMEAKYRWRQGERICPHCSQPAIIKGREEYGGGWLCFARKGGCGAKFPDAAPKITEQQTGRVLNPDIFDQVNTVLKMACKRALVDAVLKALRASGLFTQDMEEAVSQVESAPADEAASPGSTRASWRGVAAPPLRKSAGGEKRNGVTAPARVEDVGSLIQWARFHYDLDGPHVAAAFGVATVGDIRGAVGDGPSVWADAQARIIAVVEPQPPAQKALPV